MFVYRPTIPNIESLSQSTISSFDSGSFDRNRSDGDIQQPTTSEVANIETVVAYNEDLDPPHHCYGSEIGRAHYRNNGGDSLLR